MFSDVVSCSLQIMAYPSIPLSCPLISGAFLHAYCTFIVKYRSEREKKWNNEERMHNIEEWLIRQSVFLVLWSLVLVITKCTSAFGNLYVWWIKNPNFLLSTHFYMENCSVGLHLLTFDLITRLAWMKKCYRKTKLVFFIIHNFQSCQI